MRHHNYYNDIDGPCCLYRLYSASGELLYVGVSSRVEQRLGQHRRSKAWFAEVALCTTEDHKHRASAFHAEKKAIAQENPRYNIVRPFWSEPRWA